LRSSDFRVKREEIMPKLKRLLDIDGLVSKSDLGRVAAMLPYGRD
jgi:hypothetical protein